MKKMCGGGIIDTFIIFFIFLTAVQTTERPPTDKELLLVSKHIGADFQLLGVGLGLTNAKIEQIRMNHSFSVQTQIFQMLIAWRNKEGREATVKKFLEAVNDSSINVDGEELERIFKL